MIVCNICKISKSETEFYKGRKQCKECYNAKRKVYSQTEDGRSARKKANKNYSEKHPDRIKFFQRRDYYERGGKERQIKWQRENREKTKKSAAKYRKSEKYKNRPEEKRRAVWAVNNAVERGDIAHVSTQVCDKCGEQAQDYHHHSYAKEDWLNVTPLCRSCHIGTHRT